MHLDRNNIGNVKMTRRPANISAYNHAFLAAVSIFYASYVAMEMPWTLFLIPTPRIH